MRLEHGRYTILKHITRPVIVEKPLQKIIVGIKAVLQPTIDSEGIKTFTCTQCGAIDTQTLESLSIPENKSEEKTPSLESPKTGETRNADIIIVMCTASVVLCFLVVIKKSIKKIK